MIRSIGVALVVSALTVSVAGAAEGRWTEGFGQGNLEYFIDSGAYRLLIGCPTQDGSADASSGVSLYRVRDDRQVPQFTIKVNGIMFDGPFDADSRVGANNFIALLEALHATDATVTSSAGTFRFPRSNAKSVVPIYGSKNFTCNVG